MESNIFTGNVGQAFLVLATCLLLFQLIFNRVWPLSERGAKKIDLGLACLGLISTAFEVRRFFALMQVDFARVHAQTALQNLRYGTGGAYHCRQFMQPTITPRDSKQHSPHRTLSVDGLAQ